MPNRRDLLNKRRSALLLATLMILLPWTAFSDVDKLETEQDNRQASQVVWGASGSNDTGWIDLVATGADPDNGSFAHGDLFLPFAPGAEISNMTFEIAVNGSDGYWANEPQITLLDTQTPILDWRGNGDLGRQNQMENNPPTVQNGTLSTYLKPNSISDASWELPAGVTLTDMVIEALRPADPKISYTAVDIEIHDYLANPIDGRLYILLDDDLLHLDARLQKQIVDIETGIMGRSLAIDNDNGRLLIGTEDGSVLSRSLYDSSEMPSIRDPQSLPNSGIYALEVDDYGTVWAAGNCSIHFKPIGVEVWSEYDYCQTSNIETPSDMMIIADNVYLATTNSGVHILDYTTSSSSGSVSVSVDSQTDWSTQNFLSSDQITDLEVVGNHLLIATYDAGINRRDLNSQSWIATWSTNNWLASNQVHGLSLTTGWLHILAGTTVHSYDTRTLIFQSQNQLSTLGLYQNGVTAIPWPAHPGRGPTSSTSLFSDGSGILAMQIAENPAGTLTLVSSPSLDGMEVVASIDDDESGEIWVAGGTIIDRFDALSQSWLNPIDISDYITNPGQIVAIEQDGNNKVWIGTSNAGVLRLQNTDATYIGNVGGLSSSEVSSLAYDEINAFLVVGHSQSGISIINTNAMTLVDTITTSDGLDSDFVRSVATRYGIAYMATPDKGVMRVELSTSTIIGSWQSLGADDLESTPVAVDDDVIYIGLYEFGILVVDRLTGDISDFWNQDTNSLPDDDVLSLEMDQFGGLLVGSEGSFSRYDGSTWTTMTTSGSWWNRPNVFYDVTSDGDGLYAGTNRGACKWNWQYQFQDCVSSGDGLESRFVYSIEMLGPDRAYTGGNEGAGIVNMANFSVIETWTAGDETQRSRTVKVDNILYLGFENTGIARYDLQNNEWLTTWDGSQGYIDDDDVTALVPGSAYGTIWAGGDFGLTLIDVLNDTVLIDWNRGSNPNGPTLSNQIPADIEIYNGVLHYSTQRSQGWGGGSSDNIIRIDLATNSSLTNLDAGAQLGWNGAVYGIGTVNDQLWIGVRQSGSWNNDEGTIVRWNMTNESWEEDLATIGNVLRVNARFLGDCFPLNRSSCELWVAYGNFILRRFNADTMTLLDEWTDIDGPIRGMEEYQGEYLFASMNGILRWNPVNETWLNPWTPGDGLPSNTENEFYSMKVIGNDLWAGNMESNGWNSNAQILRKDGTTGNWTTWNLGSGDIPNGYAADITLCDDIVHVAIGARFWWGNQGGVARYDFVDHDSDSITREWISAMTSGSSGLANNDPRAVTCDETNDILYIGYDTEGIGIDRYNYNTETYLPTITTADGISDDRIFPGGLLHDNNVLLAAHQFDDQGGISRLITSGTAIANGQVLDPGMDGCSIDRAPSPTGQVIYAIGRSGQTTGLNRVDKLDSSGLIASGYDELAGLTSGRVLEIFSNSTHVWVTSALSSNSFYGSSILQGEILSNGSVRWEYGYNFQQDVVNEMMLDGEMMWITTAGRGLKAIDLKQRRIISTQPALHSQMDGMVLENGTMYVGLMGNQGSAAGFQTFDTQNRQWGYGSLIAGLPSNIVRDFVNYGDHVLIATHGGIGMFNTTRNDWDNPITTINGLPSPIIEHLHVLNTTIQGGGKVLAGGSAGITVLEENNLTILNTLDFNDGLMGNTVSGITESGPVSRVVQNPDGTNTTIYHDASIFISHNGQGPTRPGVAAWDLKTDEVNGTYNIDMIPSNDVRAIVGDDWGVHIATDVAPLVHWNGSTLQMETGSGIEALQSWPPYEMQSNGQHLVVMSPRGLDVVDVYGRHNVIASEVITGLQGGDIDLNGFYAVGNDGLHVFKPVVSLQEKSREVQRRAEPLTVLYNGMNWDITDTTHPGMSTVLVTPENPMQIPSTSDVAPPGKLPMHVGTMTMLAPQRGAWVWARTSSLNYTGSWDLAASNGGIQQSFQSAISDVGPGSSSAILQLQLRSPEDGAIQVRITYDWERIEVPTVVTQLEDRPNDGGGVIEATWLQAEDAAWHAYRLYVWDSTTDPLWEPTREDLDSFSTYIRSDFWSRTNATVTKADNNGVTVDLRDDRQYRAAIVIEYADGSLGVPMSYPYNVTPTDEVPNPPAWMIANPISGGTAGTVELEWASCTELDRDRVRIWAVQQEIDSAVGLSNPLDFPWSLGNSTTLQLDAGVPYWFAAVCVDESGQSLIENATIIGPIVTAGGLDDGIPPLPITGTTAFDVPNDEGGRINVTWNQNLEDDCTYYAVYALPASGWQPPSTVDGWPVVGYTSDCETTSIIIDSLGQGNLIDGTVYWIGVVAFDDWGNGDLDNVLVVDATPEADSDGVAIPPDRVTGLEAWDYANDDGSAVDIRWNRSSAEDFSYYTIWVSEYPLDDVTEIWDSCSEAPSSCGLVIINQRQFGASFQLEYTADKALYGSSLDSLELRPIQSMIPLYVTVTIHDISGNVHLTELSEHMVLVTPLDNRGDVSPPDRLPTPVLQDRPNDAGDAMFVEFQSSDSSDIAEYWIYAVIDTPVLLERIDDLHPAMAVSREQDLPVLLTEFSAHGDDLATPLVPNRRIYVAVVAVDSSGNAWMDKLASTWIELSDELSADPCPECPDVSGIRANWNAAGSLIEVNWDNEEDPIYANYYAFVSLDPFDDTRDATLVKSGIRDTILILNEFNGSMIDRDETYWIEIVTYNGQVHTYYADPVEVLPWKESNFGTNQPGDETSGESWVDRILAGEMNMAIIALSVVMLLIGAMMFIRPRGDSAPQPWEMGAMEVELEEQLEREAAGLSEDEDFGIDEIESSDGLVANARIKEESTSDESISYNSENLDGEGDLIDEDADFAPSTDNTVIDELLGDDEELDLGDLDDLADDLNFDDESEDEDIDTSFIDDIL